VAIFYRHGEDRSVHAANELAPVVATDFNAHPLRSTRSYPLAHSTSGILVADAKNVFIHAAPSLNGGGYSYGLDFTSSAARLAVRSAYLNPCCFAYYFVSSKV
jgi:hypothetical protein